VIATAVAIAARRLRIPYTVALVLSGLVLGVAHLFEPPELNKELLYAVFLPGLLFEAAFHLDFHDFWRDRRVILALAIPGVVVAVALIALILEPIAQLVRGGEGFGWSHAVIFGAIIAATDPIAVVSMFRTLGAPRRMIVRLEAESLLNDGTAVVVFSLVLGLMSGQQISGVGLVIEFVRIVGGGLAVGALTGLAIAQVIKRIDDPMIEITLTTIAAYGSFLAAEELGFSGVIATVAAGMLSGNYAARIGMAPSTRIAAETFWEYVAFALNSIVFLLVGLHVHLRELAGVWLLIVVAYAAVTVARAGVVFGVLAFERTTRDDVPRAAYGTVLTWGGMRGSLSMVLALALPPMPARELLIAVTFGVVLLSILLQGLTMTPLLKRLGIVGRHEARQAYERKQGELRMTHAALSEIAQMRQQHSVPAAVLGELSEEYEARARVTAAAIEALRLEQDDLRAEESMRARRQVLLAEKASVLDDSHRGALSTEASESLLASIDARLGRLNGTSATSDREPKDVANAASPSTPPSSAEDQSSH
jgi:Na+:H+ antiporter